MPRVEFLCGCTTGNIENRANVLTMDSIEFDLEGFLSCKVHKQRRKGWRSYPRSTSHPGQKHSYLGLSLIDVEARAIFREEFPIRSIKLKESTEEDRRDKRDPQETGERIIRGLLVQIPQLPEIREQDEPGKGMELLIRNRGL